MTKTADDYLDSIGRAAFIAFEDGRRWLDLSVQERLQWIAAARAAVRRASKHRRPSK